MGQLKVAVIKASQGMTHYLVMPMGSRLQAEVPPPDPPLFPLIALYFKKSLNPHEMVPKRKKKNKRTV